MTFKPGNDDGKDTQFKPGESGNPAGKAPGTENLTTSLRKYMEMEIEVVDPITKEPGKKKIRDIINMKAIANAIKGDQKAIQFVHERLEGKPRQEMDINANVTKMDKIKKDGKEIDFNVGDTKTAGHTE
jgi:hypothetical protein